MSCVKTVAFKLLVMVPDILLGPQCEGIEDRPQLEFWVLPLTVCPWTCDFAL